MSNKKPPYQHKDGSNCWTKNCSRDHMRESVEVVKGRIDNLFAPKVVTASSSSITQRTNGFNAGIQIGTTASSKESIGLETIVREAVKNLNLPDGWTWVKGLSKAKLQKLLNTDLEVAGVEPDGGIILNREGVPVIAIEAKKQGKNGNAIERWYKNHRVMKALGCKLYLTVFTGEGFFNSNSAERSMNLAVALSRGTTNANTESFWNNKQEEDWFYRYKTIKEAKENIPKVINDAILEATSR